MKKLERVRDTLDELRVSREAKRPIREARKRVRVAGRERKRRERQERLRFSAHARRRRRRVWIGASAVLGLALFVAVGVFTPLMSVKEIEVRGTSRIATADVVDALLPLQGTPLALVSSDEVHGALSDFALIQQYTLDTIPPSTLLVTIQEREPVLAVTRGEQVQLVDPAGIVVETLSAADEVEGVPFAEGLGNDYTTARFRAAAQVAYIIPSELSEQVESITAASAQSVSMQLTNGIEVVWGDASDSTRKAVVLLAMLEALADTDVSQIDVSSSQAPVFVQ